MRHYYTMLLILLIGCQKLKQEKTYSDSFIEHSNSDSIFDNFDTCQLTATISYLRSYNELEYKHLGITGRESDLYKQYEWMSEHTSIEELIDLVHDSNTVVSCYAGWALIDKNYEKLFEIYKYYIDNGKSILTHSGCIAMPLNTSTIFYDHYKNIKSFRNIKNVQMDSLTEMYNKADALLYK